MGYNYFVSLKGKIMNNNYCIITDSGCDLPRAMAKELDVTVLDLTVLVDGCEPAKDSQVDLKEFYDLLREQKNASTAAINIDDFLSAMEEVLKEGKDVLYLGFSSGLSSTYSSGAVAAEELAAKYPERKIYTVDTLCASLGQGLLVYLAANKRNEGASIEEVRDFVENNKLNLCHQFTVDDLFFLHRGGRVSKTSAVMGTMLKIKPVLHVDNAGKLIKVGTVRGRKASVNALFDKTKETIINPTEQVMFICHGDCVEDAEYVAERFKNELGVKDVIIGYVGSVIGSHSGPGTLALFYLGTER
jgi:DegV family protein with EDD domain